MGGVIGGDEVGGVIGERKWEESLGTGRGGVIRRRGMGGSLGRGSGRGH